MNISFSKDVVSYIYIDLQRYLHAYNFFKAGHYPKLTWLSADKFRSKRAKGCCILRQMLGKIGFVWPIIINIINFYSSKYLIQVWLLVERCGLISSTRSRSVQDFSFRFTHFIRGVIRKTLSIVKIHKRSVFKRCEHKKDSVCYIYNIISENKRMCVLYTCI